MKIFNEWRLSAAGRDEFPYRRNHLGGVPPDVGGGVGREDEGADALTERQLGELLGPLRGRNPGSRRRVG